MFQILRLSDIHFSSYKALQLPPKAASDVLINPFPLPATAGATVLLLIPGLFEDG